MLIAQISDMHVTAEGTLLYKRIDTAGYQLEIRNQRTAREYLDLG